VLESLELDTVEPYRDLAYEWAAGTARFAVRADEPSNTRIVDLGAVAPDHDGMVRFRADVRLLRPTSGGSERALVVVPNRGMLGGLPFSLDVPLMMPTAGAPEPGDGFLLDRGWTIAWCGWQWDVVREGGGLGLEAPLATVEPGVMRVEFRPDVDEPTHGLGDSSFLFHFAHYPTVDVADPEATLSVRTAPLGQKETVPRKRWRFVDETHFEIDGGFRAFHWYELVYRSAIAPVVGTGLLAFRDFASSLRDTHNFVFATGRSQSGRFLRQLLFDGLNVDERGNQVFDGVFAHIASARRGEFNCRYGQPALTHPLTPGYGPPYDSAGLLERQRALGGAPKVFFANSSWEYWRGDGALVHQDPHTGTDLPEDPDVRSFHVAGTDHFGKVPIKESLPLANPVHLLDPEPILRALFVQLEQWVCEGVEPSPSQVPRQVDGTAVTRAEALRSFHDVALPDPESLPFTPAIDPDSTTWPLELGDPMVALVSAVDAGGNEVAGIRLPAVAAPVAAYTGWNPRAHREGLPDVLYEFAGSRLPLQTGSPTSDRADYEREVRRVAGELVAARFLIEPDAERTVAEALALYDWAGPIE